MESINNPLETMSNATKENDTNEEFDLSSIDEVLNDVSSEIEETEVSETNSNSIDFDNSDVIGISNNAESIESTIDDSSEDKDEIDGSLSDIEDQEDIDKDILSRKNVDKTVTVCSTVEEEPLVDSKQVCSEAEGNTECMSNIYLETLSSEITEVQERLTKLLDFVVATIQDSKKRENAVTVLSDTIREYKLLVEEKLVKSCFREIIGVRDSMIHMSREIERRSEGEPNVPMSTFLSFSDDLETILFNNDVETYRSKVGDRFDPKKQRVLKKIAVDNESMHGIIAESTSDGYMYSGRVISPEKVIVYFYQKS